jgi:predicted nucleic-acid-binding Zn-ribbon protein
MKDYADQLIMEGRNNVNHHDEYIYPEKLNCHGKCLEDHRNKYDKNTQRNKYYEFPKRKFKVRETGMWTTITCKTCGWSHFWAAGDGDDWF